MNQETINILILVSPLIIGGIIAAINANSVNDTTEKVEAWTRRTQSNVSTKSRWFYRYIINPILWVIVKFSDWTDSFTHRGLKNGIRVAATLYLIAAWCFILYAAFMIIVIVAIFIAVLYIVFKVFLHSNEDVRRGYERGKNIFTSSNDETEVYDKEELRIFEGKKTWQEPMATLVGNRVFEGKKTWEEPIATIEGNKIFRGNKTWEEPIATIEGNKIFDGKKTWEDPIATIEGNKVFDGKKTWEEPIATFEGGQISGAVAGAVWFHYYQK